MNYDGTYIYRVVICTNLSREEDLNDLETNLKRELREYYVAHFVRSKGQVIEVWSC